MKKSILLFVALLFLFPLTGTTFAGIPGATDKVLGASLLVPFFEVAVNKETNPQDTLLVVFNTRPSTSTLHYHVWDMDGNPTDIFGNPALTASQSWSIGMGDIIATASAAAKAQLIDGTTGFYHGFVTIDLVTASTTLDPTNSAFPFEDSNVLEGVIYYVRLSQGSANGLDMIPLEYISASIDSYFYDFYQNSDRREEIDSDARLCAQTTIEGGTCSNNPEIDRMDFRVFLTPAISGGSRLIIFTWDADEIGGPSKYCDTNTCSSHYSYKRYDEAGIEKENTTIRLDHVVNIFDVSGTENGWVSISDMAARDFQVFGFAFNSASSSSASTNWDAIFPAYIIP